jgi:hypothetical protein
MTLAELSERLGIPTRTLYRYRRDFPDQVPKNFELESWREFIGKIKNYPAERTRPADQNGTEAPAEDQNDEYAEYSAGEERKQRILRLRLGNQVRRTSLERLNRNTVTMVECTQAMERIRAAVSGDLLGVPVNLCQKLTHRDPGFIQQVLETALRFKFGTVEPAGKLSLFKFMIGPDRSRSRRRWTRNVRQR